MYSVALLAALALGSGSPGWNDGYAGWGGCGAYGGGGYIPAVPWIGRGWGWLAGEHGQYAYDWHDFVPPGYSGGYGFVPFSPYNQRTPPVWAGAPGPWGPGIYGPGLSPVPSQPAPEVLPKPLPEKTPKQ